jgi:putative nucleotidyltransferase with HDIG domain
LDKRPTTAEKMPRTTHFSRTGRFYIGAVVAAGATILVVSVQDLYQQSVWLRWAPLAALTLLSGSATVKLPSVPATISISETFVFTSVLLFGPAAGAVIVALDGLIISCWLTKRRRELHRLAFNMAAPALSIWLAAHVYFAFPGVRPLIYGGIPIADLLLPIAVFTVCHFLLNTWLIAFAVAAETHRRAIEIWRSDFLWLLLNYFGGASVSALLVVYTRDITVSLLGIIVPLLLILYFTFKIPMARVEDTNRHLGQVNTLYLSTIETLAMAIDAKDQVTHGHIRRVQSYAVGLSTALGIHDVGLLKAIEASALLHDMGKLAIPEYILNKPGQLSAAEFTKMKMHAAIGADILSAIEFPYPVVPIVRHHHENWDGTGYPDGLAGTSIPIGARILAVVDCFDALTSDRPYRPRLPHEEATRILMERRGTMYDPLVVDTFIRVQPTLYMADQEHPSMERVVILDEDEQALSCNTESPLTPDSTTIRARDGRTQLEAENIEAVCLRLRKMSSASASVLALYDEGRDDLVIRHISGQSLDSLLNERVQLGQRSLGWVGATRQAILNSDPSLDFEQITKSVPGKLTAGLVVPVCEGDRLVGVLGLYSSRPFTHESKQFVESSLKQLGSLV